MATTKRVEDRKETVERLLRTKAAHIEGHLDALQDEINTLVPSLREVVDRNPMVAVGGALLAGLAVGLLFGGRKHRQPTITEAHRALIDGYITAVFDEARRRKARGQDLEEALRETLEGHVPIIIYEEPGESERPGLLRQFSRVAFRSLLGIGIKTGVDFLTGALGPSGASQEAMRDTSESAVATAVASEAVGN